MGVKIFIVRKFANVIFFSSEVLRGERRNRLPSVDRTVVKGNEFNPEVTEIERLIKDYRSIHFLCRLNHGHVDLKLPNRNSGVGTVLTARPAKQSQPLEKLCRHWAQQIKTG